MARTPKYVKEQEQQIKLEKLAKDYKVENLLEEKGVLRLLNQVEHLQEMLDEAEKGNVPIYCPECSSCGEEGCCSPNACVAVRCLYKERNLKSYWECRDENKILWELLEKGRKSPLTIEDANIAHSAIEAVWAKTLDEHQKQITE